MVRRGEFTHAFPSLAAARQGEGTACVCFHPRLIVHPRPAFPLGCTRGKTLPDLRCTRLRIGDHKSVLSTVLPSALRQALATILFPFLFVVVSGAALATESAAPPSSGGAEIAHGEDADTAWDTQGEDASFQITTETHAASPVNAAGAGDSSAGGVPDALKKNEEEEWGESGGVNDANGFGLTPALELTLKKPETSTRPWRLQATMRSDWGLWTERLKTNPFAKGRQSLDLRFDYANKAEGFKAHASVYGAYDFAYLNQRSSYRKPTLDAYEWLVQIRETYMALEVGAFELTFGRLISAWGEGDILGVLDVVNPRDLREPGQADLDDIRLPVLSSRIGYFNGAHRVEGLVIHEAYFGLLAPPLGFYSPFPGFFSQAGGFSAAQLGFDPNAMLATKNVYYRHHPERFNVNNQQFLARWVYRGSGIDLGLYAASVLQQQGVVVLPTLSPEILLPDNVYIDLEHPRYTMVGHSGALPYKAWLLKWELGFDFNKSFNTGHINVIPPVIETHRSHLFNSMIGLTYTGLTDTVLTAEIQKSVLLKDVDNLLIAVERPYMAFRGEHRFFRGLIRFSLVALILGFRAEQGALIRGNMIYAFRDGMNLSMGYISYLPGKNLGPFAGFTTHDRFLLQYRWDFTAL